MLAYLFVHFRVIYMVCDLSHKKRISWDLLKVSHNRSRLTQHGVTASLYGVFTDFIGKERPEDVMIMVPTIHTIPKVLMKKAKINNVYQYSVFICFLT